MNISRKPDALRLSKPLIIPVFIMNSGCPEACIYCNQKITAGNFPAVLTRDLFNAEIESYLHWNRDGIRSVEIAFYGGSFTGLKRDYQKKLLDWAGSYIQSGQVESLRISTRPDLLDEDSIVFLKQRGVRTVEIGAQSFNDDVLRAVGRSHTASDTKDALLRLQKHGFTTGVHLMAGLPQDDREGFLRSLEQTILLRPDLARIHPLIVFNDTPLAGLYQQGRYTPLELDEAVEYCVLAWERLAPQGISIIRFGLQTTPEMNRPGAYLAGPLHPALGSLVYGRLYWIYTRGLLESMIPLGPKVRFELSDADAAHFRGHKNANLSALKTLYPGVDFTIDALSDRPRGRLTAVTVEGLTRSVTIPGIHPTSRSAQLV